MPQGRDTGKNSDILPQIRSNVLIALGSNLTSHKGDLTETVIYVTQLIDEQISPIRVKSRLFSTPAFPPGSGPDYVNAALAVETDLSPHEIMRRLHDIEARLGRERKARWAERTIDLDLIAIDDLVLPNRQVHAHWRDLTLQQQMTEVPEALILPHPRMHERAFVLVPLADVAPDWRHPILGRTVREMLDDLPEAAKQEVVALQ